jgi:hypothetical protein
VELRDGRNKLEMLDPNQSASITEPLYCIMGRGVTEREREIERETERERLCLSRPSYSSKNSNKMLGRRTRLTDYTDNI